ncbi:MAG: GNAT family N-acetyltransferase [Phenylobacterium sp.]|uniref:GNAT family N-acetyltransferase n=1 Tax=Phenylobacterium sp. TaxID=1871053 RepID=UPI00391C5602
MPQPSVIVDLAGPADLPALHALVESAYRGDAARAGWTHEADLLQGQRTSLESLAAAVADPCERILLLRLDGALAGCVQVSDRGGGRAYLGMLAVDPARQAGGFGRRLIAEAERLAAETFGATSIEMTVIDRRTELVAYYLRRGYAETGETRPFPTVTDPPLRFTVLAKAIGAPAPTA